MLIEKINIALLPGLNVRYKEALSIPSSYRITHPSSTEAVSKKVVIKSGKGCGSKRWENTRTHVHCRLFYEEQHLFIKRENAMSSERKVIHRFP